MSETKPRRRWPFVVLCFVGGFGVLLAAFLLLFRWDWLIPAVQSRASAALGRPVTISHLHVRLGRVPHIEAEGVVIGNPADWPGGGNLATIDKLGLDVDAMAYIRRRQVVIPAITAEHPVAEVQQLADGRNNYTFPTGDPNAPAEPPEKATQIGDLRISDGHAHVAMAKLRSDFKVDVATEGEAGREQIVASAKGTYGAQPITARFTGGALLSLRDAAQPYPIDLEVANGPTKVSLKGTVQNPLSFAGANVRLEIAGPDMSLLLPLTGIAIPKTPAYRVSGQLDYTKGVVRFTKSSGTVGSSDLEGDIEVDTKPEQRPVVTATLSSRLVDLKDLGGFIGAEPGDAAKGTKRAVARNGRVLPSDPISLPRLNAADVHLKYRAARIQGRSQPLDNMRADLEIVNGAVALHPLAFGIGGGSITAQIDATEMKAGLQAKATVDFQRVSLDRLLSATGAARGAGTVGGRAVIDGTGRSLAEILGSGNGELKLYMGSGGNVSALLVDLSGLQFGNALLSALGIPNRARIQCFIVDIGLERGLGTLKALVLDTDEARAAATGSLSLYNEAVKITINTESKHFSVGSLHAPVNVTGTFANPSVLPDLVELGARAGAAVGLGILLTPLGALLPTIELGTGEDGACRGLLNQVRTPPRSPVRTRR